SCVSLCALDSWCAMTWRRSVIGGGHLSAQGEQGQYECAPKISEEALKKEEELDKYLETRVEELLGNCGEAGVPDLVSVLRSIASENIPNLPPGGGLASKRSVIEAVYNKLNPHREEEGACAGGEEESEEGGGSTAAHLLEALRQFRLHHRGQYQSDGDNNGQQQPASPPSPRSPPPSPATAEPEASQDAPALESDPSSD
ncbi:hypothetical protein KUCAC02_027052, partial [Chaenocephalus aceratus]